MFRKLFDKHFLKTSKLHKIFNRNNVKVSCSCLPNFANMIKSHNNRILSEQKTQDQPKCNCRQKDTCPLKRHCLDKELIYRCILKENTTSDGVKYNVLEIIHLKTDFISTAIPSSRKVRQILENYLSISGKRKEIFDHAKPYQNGFNSRLNYLFRKKHFLTTSLRRRFYIILIS